MLRSLLSKVSFIHLPPLPHPASSSWEKKDGGLYPCIDFRALNVQTVKFKYSFPKVPVTLEQLQGAHIFSKMDLQSAYNLVCVQKGDE